MKCPQCGAEVPAGDRFCGECGQSMLVPDTQQTMYAPAVEQPAAQQTAAQRTAAQQTAAQRTADPAQWPPPPQAASWSQPAPVASAPESATRKRRFPWLIAVIVVLGLCVVCVGGGAAAYVFVVQPRLAETTDPILTAAVTATSTPSQITVSTPTATAIAAAPALPALPTSTFTPIPTSTSTPIPTTTYRDEYGAYTVGYPVEWVVIGELPGDYAFLAESEEVSDDLAAGPFFFALTYPEVSDLDELRVEVVAFFESFDVRDVETVPAQFAGLESAALMMTTQPAGTSAEVQIYALLAIRDGSGQAFAFGAAAERWDEKEPLFEQMTESLSMQGTVTQPMSTPQITWLTFASTVDEFGNPVGETDVYPPGTTEVYAVFGYEGLGGVTEYEPVFFLNGQMDVSEPLALEGGAEGQTWLRRYDDEGLAPGEYELDIYVGDEWLGGGVFTVLGGSVVLQDDFGGVTTDWKTWQGEDSRVWHADGRLHVLITSEAWMAYPTYAPQAGGTYGDVYLEVDAALVELPEQGGDYGLILRRAQEGDYYQFVISDDGYFKIRKHTAEGWTTLLDWIENDAIVQGVNAVNRLQAVAWGSELLFYVNGVHLGRAVDDAFAEGHIGVSAGSFAGGPGVHAVFDNVVVYQIE